MIFYKTEEVTKEEMRLQKLEDAFKGGKLSNEQYLSAINKLKGTGEGAAVQRPASVLDIVQLFLIVAVVLAGVYALKLVKS
ncbi:MAG: hypothetical protein HY884_05435 [Deltaproteobacteria bacterium]|nr:hypothetical protein [Deltaproteobacteria bacterium]